ncbi:beta-N-acetylhexosaminidase [Fibrella forsythiae]|uniref:beta-N-acetylhexosaminidase n=1 Tax=Fibrella forsythiae TaxID=2817061 RepID=A0ABS3JH36_9BACT|nr:family 20 glycosylhydrolase [Fibrella forsythiae]MBO0949326.1 family 20 glycosylhydrolase [Fibrella forsythiae]
MKAILFGLLTLSLPTFAQLPLPALIPQPQSIQAGTGQFTITAKTQLAVLTPVAEVRQMVQTSLPGLRINDLAKPANNITVRLAPVANIGREGYELVVSPTGIRLTAPEAAGIFYGLQTLRQLLPAERERPGFRFTGTSVTTSKNGIIPAVVIRDQPRFGWRGMMLDVSRSFFTKEYVKQFIDLMARYKYNVFHWHLTDDQGWRIEIKSLPRLTQVGAWRAPRTGRWNNRENPVPGETQSYGGFYTQDEIREVVQYAAERQVMVVPEIDMPGHMLAAIAAYPNLTCSGKVVPIYPNGKFYKLEDNTLNPCNDSTYLFIDKVFTEIAQLFPGPYIHVGGDEAFKGFWEQCAACKPLMAANGLKNVEEIQSYFIRRVEKIVQSKGKRLIGWDEILEGGLAPNATVMSWRGMNGGIAAAKQGHPVIMTPFQNCYVDLYQGDPSAEPSTYGICRLSNSYAFEPVPDSVRTELILGGQANLWTESVPTSRHAEYMVWPRAFAIAEVLWSPKNTRNWPDFVRRVESHFSRFDVAGINYSRSYLNPYVTVQKQTTGIVEILLNHELAGIDLFYTTDNTLPDAMSPKYMQPFVFPKGADRLRVVAYRDGKPIGRMLDIPFTDLATRAR